MWSELQEACHVPYKIYSLSGKFAMLQAAVFTELSCLYGDILDHCNNKWLGPRLGPSQFYLFCRGLMAYLEQKQIGIILVLVSNSHGSE